MHRIAIAVQPQIKSSEIILAPGLLFSESIVSELKPLASRFAIFCDEQVDSVLGQKWKDYLCKMGLEAFLFIFGSGEKEKCQERKIELENMLLSQRFGRDTCIIALGGGVTTDLIGFIAATFCRGVPLINVPTSLLAMVDAAIGGKTGINTPFGKNLIGTFYPADKILIDPNVLETLPSEEWTNGCAEVVKYALIRSPQLFKSLKKWNPADPIYLESILRECVLIKAQVVEQDYEEKTGLRRILNFGHTIGHALEHIENYQISHGEAVAIGMIVESYLSMKKGLISPAIFDEIERLIRSFAFKLRLSPSVALEKMRETLVLDKKSSHGVVRFVLLEKIGACCPFKGTYCSEIPSTMLDDAICWMITSFSGEQR